MGIFARSVTDGPAIREFALCATIVVSSLRERRVRIKKVLEVKVGEGELW